MRHDARRACHSVALIVYSTALHYTAMVPELSAKVLYNTHPSTCNRLWYDYVSSSCLVVKRPLAVIKMRQYW